MKERALIHRLATIVLITLVGDAAAQLPAAPAAALSQPDANAVVVTDIAIAYASDDSAGGLDIEPWTENGVAVGDTLGARVDYFTVVPERVQLGVGGRLNVAQIRLVTHGLNGEPVPRAPFKISIEAPAGLLDIESATREQVLLAMRPGIGRLWIESLLPRGTGTGERYRMPVPILIR